MAKFNFRLPILTDLTRTQRRAIDAVNPILITGVPGSGKTVVSIYRLGNFIKSGNKSVLFVYNRMLRAAIRNSSTNIGIGIDNVHSIHRWFTDLNNGWLTDYDNRPLDLYKELQNQNVYYDKVIFDEGQDLPVSIYQAFKKISNVSVGADNAQQLYDVDTTEESILDILPSLEQYELDENFRNSYEIFNFAKEFVPHNARAHDTNLLEKIPKNNAMKPNIYVNENLNETKEMIKKVIDGNRGNNIAILAPNQGLVEEYYKTIKDDYQCSMYHNKLSEKEKLDTEENLQNILVTTFKSSKGMEFDTVIMVGFEQTREEDRNQYFVGATRAKTRLFVFCIVKLAKIFESFNPSTYELKIYDHV